MKLPILARAAAIAAVAIAILLPIGMIGGKVSERQARAEAVVAQFASETSGPQLVAGPFLALICEETFVEERQVMRAGKAQTVAEKKVAGCPIAYFAPRAFKASASLPVETRHRGLYTIRLYRAQVDIAGEFDWPEPALWHGANQRQWKQVYVVLCVRDARGIKAIVSSLSGALLDGAAEAALAQFSVRESLGAYGSRKAGEAVPFSYKLDLVGTSTLVIAPVGDRSEIRMRSDWPHPSFGQAWSPDERSIGANGFEAAWRMTSVATGGRATWQKLAGEGKIAAASGAGASLFDPVNIYALSHRATEYAFLFVLFTFGALALTEAVASARLHPIQYALVGSAIAVFFLLLLALSEHMRFSLAYGLAAAACISLLTYYLRHPLGTLRRTALFLAISVALYGSLFVLLTNEDHALLMGSLMVFALLAVAMLGTRKLDWNAVSARMRVSPAPSAGP